MSKSWPSVLGTHHHTPSGAGEAAWPDQDWVASLVSMDSRTLAMVFMVEPFPEALHAGE